MKIILIRHASRVQKPELGQDKDLPLTSGGRKEALNLAEQLATHGLKPAVYLTSRYAHAVETADLLRDQVSGTPPRVVPLAMLTPHEEYTLEGIIREAQQHGCDLDKIDQIGIVLHHPRLNQLLAKLTPRPESPKAPDFAEAVCLSADSLQDFIRAKGKEVRRL